MAPLSGPSHRIPGLPALKALDVADSDVRPLVDILRGGATLGEKLQSLSEVTGIPAASLPPGLILLVQNADIIDWSDLGSDQT